ncbi:Uncharacterised protein [Mycobacteroides abscessus subsp. abscessus]|nr:Uncharacterised protein [Mycobacteroides abscessus subsp. abscessus]
MARPSANNSSSAANVPGTGSPSMARCASVRDDEKPRAPASIASWTSFAMALMSSALAGSLRAPRSPMAYARTAPCAIWAPMSTASSRCPTTSRYSPKLSQPHVMPSVRAVPGMSSTPSMRAINHSSWPGRTGAKPTPQLPATTVVTPWLLDGSSTLSQLTCPS